VNVQESKFYQNARPIGPPAVSTVKAYTSGLDENKLRLALFLLIDTGFLPLFIAISVMWVF